MATATVGREARDLELCEQRATRLDVEVCLQPGCYRPAVWKLGHGQPELCTRHAARRIRRLARRSGGAR
jgi:hypothetical protein